VLVNGLHPGPVLLLAGALSLAAGLWFQIPFPVQPLKALTALAVAQRLTPDVIRAAGLLIGVILVLLAVTGVAERAARAFTKPVIRALQLAVGTLLVMSAYRLARTPPELFTQHPSPGWTVALALGALATVAIAVQRRWHAAAAVLVVAGVAAAVVAGDPQFGEIVLHGPVFALPPPQVWGAAFVLLVIPQLPLTYGNAVVGVADLARERFPSAHRVRAGTVALSSGLGNIASALAGGMPMCHGSSGFTAHVRLGAHSQRMNIMLGGAFLFLGGVCSEQVLVLFGLLPVWALAGFLAYAGLRHALLVVDLRGAKLALAIIAAVAGIVTGNLAYTAALALTTEWLPRLARRAPVEGS
jgi:sulfate permease, SulP family